MILSENDIQVLELSNSLELALTRQQELKVNALKVLKNKTIKSLISQLDAKDKEYAKLLESSKDTRRIEMINDLKQELNFREQVIEVLKKEIIAIKNDHSDDNDFNKDKINEWVVKKTLDGLKVADSIVPTREALELKMRQLESKIKKLELTIQNNQSLAAPKILSKVNENSETITDEDKQMENLSLFEIESLKCIASLLDGEIQKYKDIVCENEETMRAKDKEIMRLQQLLGEKDDSAFPKENYQDLQKSYEDELNINSELRAKLSKVSDDFTKLKRVSTAKQDDLRKENEEIKEKFIQLKNKNIQLTNQIMKYEVTLDHVDSNHPSNSSVTSNTFKNEVAEKFFEQLIDCCTLFSRGLVSLHEDFKESVLVELLKTYMKSNISLRSQAESFMNSDESSSNTRDKLKLLIRLCNKIEGTSEIIEI